MTTALTRRDLGDATVLEVHGELDMAVSAELGQAIRDALSGRPEQLVVDLSDVQFVDTSALSVLLNARRSSRRAGVDLKLACLQPETLRLFALMRLDGDFDIYATSDDALHSRSPLPRFLR